MFEHSTVKAEATSENFTIDDSFEKSGFVAPVQPFQSDHNVLSLDDFFKRPVFIHEQTIDVLEQVNTIIDPLRRWTSDPSVRSKLAHYAYLRGDLHLNIVTSSSKYHYGLLLLSYQPFPKLNPTLQALIDLSVAEPASGLVYNNYLSQSPTKQYLVIGEDTSIEMTLPFISPTNSIRLYNQNGALMTNAIDYEDTVDFGDLIISAINPVDSADGNTSPNTSVTLQIYAWMDNIELGPITATKINITAEAQADADYNAAMTVADNKINQGKSFIEDKVNQGKAFREKVNNHPVLKAIANEVGGMVSDEYNSAGPTAKIASAVSNFTSNFGDVPVLGIAAKATSYVTAKAAALLKYWGFSKPIQLEPLIFAKTLPFSNGCVLDNKETHFKLSADPKQELSIQQFTGDNLDPMAINSITSVETYFHTMDWNTDAVPRTTTIGLFPIVPTISTVYEKEDTQLVHQLTALAFPCLAFNFWRGSITFKFEAIASSFHRGKLMFIYEPNGSQIDLIMTGTTDFNQNYIAIMDLEKTRTIEITCGYVNNRAFSKTFVTDTTNANVDLTIPFPIHNYQDSVLERNTIIVQHNENVNLGFIYVQPLTRLVTPLNDNTTFVGVNCYVSSKDICFSSPITTSTYTTTTVIAESSSQTIVAESSSDDRVSTKSTTRILINKIQPTNDDIFLSHFGEQIPSFRSLLKRDDTFNIFPIASTSLGHTQYRIPMYPTCAESFIPSNGSYVFPPLNTTQAKRCLFNYLRFGFSFMKGGYRHKLIEVNETVNKAQVTVTRAFIRDLDAQLVIDLSLSGTSDILAPDLTGTVIFDAHASGGVEYEIPFYSQLKFTSTTPLAYHAPLHPLFKSDNPSAKVVFVHDEVDKALKLFSVGSTAEDFTFDRFNGATFFVS